MRLIGWKLVEEALHDSAEEVVVLIDPGKDAEKVLIRKQTLLQAFIQEVLLRFHHLIDGLHAAIEELSFEF